MANGTCVNIGRAPRASFLERVRFRRHKISSKVPREKSQRHAFVRTSSQREFRPLPERPIELIEWLEHEGAQLPSLLHACLHNKEGRLWGLTAERYQELPGSIEAVQCGVCMLYNCRRSAGRSALPLVIVAVRHADHVMEREVELTSLQEQEGPLHSDFMCSGRSATLLWSQAVSCLEVTQVLS